jgi:membrane-associated protease RseP (regulator of RpoE activity)
MTIGIVVFVVSLVLSVTIHEAGHFLTAKKFGMKATQFFFGFGPTLWSFRRGETEYGVKAIPAGGFVKIVGMTPLEEVPEADKPRAFYRQPAPQRAVVLAAGSFMHFAIGFVLLFVISSVVGEVVSTNTVANVSPCAPRSATAAGKCPKGAPPSPAKQVGLRPGDTILAVGGHRVHDFAEAGKLIRKRPGQRTAVRIKRHGRALTLHPTFAAEKAGKDGAPGTHPGQKIGFFGFGSTERVVHYAPWTGVARAGDHFGQQVVGTFQGLGQIPQIVPDLFASTFGHQARNPRGVSSVVGIARLTGEASASTAPLADQIDLMLGIIVAYNVFIGIFNLFPLLPLDGGHLAVLGFEKARSGIFRVVGRRDPGRVDLVKLLPTAYLVFAVIVGVSLLAVFADIVNPIANPFG